MRNYRLSFLLSHQIQYFSPLFREINKKANIDLTVYYCSDETVKRFKDKEFGKFIEWDIPLLEGYKYKFLKNYSPKPSIYAGFFGLTNLNVIQELKKDGIGILIVHGWGYFTHIYAIIIARLSGITVLLRGENTLSLEILKPYWKRLIKKLILQYGIFKLVNVFLYIGIENKKFYKYYGVPENKLVFAPYCVENKRFHSEYRRLKRKRNELKIRLGFPEDTIITLFVGKLIDKKRPLDLIKAYEKIRSKKKSLVIVGDGILRKKLGTYVNRYRINNVYFVGFKNQTELPSYYTIADVFVLPSGLGETWGLVVNEAMNFELPIITSSIVGCSDDLVRHGENGFVYKMGNIDELAGYLEFLITNEESRKEFGSRSLEIVKNYSYGSIINGIVKGLNEVK